VSAVLFFIAGTGAVLAALAVVLVRNPFYSVLALAFHLLCLAALFLLLRAEFVAAAQVVVYAGAMMVLYVFVVAYVGGGEQLQGGAVLRVLGPLFALALAVELCIAMLGAGLSGVSKKGAPYIPGFGSPRHIGTLFLTKYLFPFEIASIVLLVAAVGAVVLARRRRGLEPDEEIELRIRTPMPHWMGTMAEAAGTRVGDTTPSPEAEPVASARAGARGDHAAADDRGGW
jgi:NADH:ubiquinone oxidoreductase subunit 6 (subunit J)